MNHLRNNTTGHVAAIFLVAACFQLTNCTGEEIVVQHIEEPAQRSISFSPLTKNALSTRSSIVGLNKSTMTDFEVWAWRPTDGSNVVNHMGEPSDGIRIIKKSTDREGGTYHPISNDGITPETWGWGYANDNEWAYWGKDIDEEFQFIAISPAHDVDVVKTINKTDVTYQNINFPANHAQGQFTYTAGTNTDINNSTQRDILVSAKKQGYSTTGGVVQMEFSHALSQIVFDVNVPVEFHKTGASAKDDEFYIHSIKLCNIKNKGVCTLTPNATGTLIDNSKQIDLDNNCVNWTITNDATEEDYFIQAPRTGTNNSYASITWSKTTGFGSGVTTAISTQEGGDNIMIIPQTLTPWNPAENYGTDSQYHFETVNGAYVIIDMTWRKYNTSSKVWEYEFGLSPDAGTDIYAPFKKSDGSSFTFEPGKKYTITITLGRGYSNEGSSTQDITFTISGIDSWTAGESQPDPNL